MVYEGCKLYGPYSNSKDGRLRCMLVFPDNTRKTISYPKYIMEVYLGRYLETDETIDHIDGDFLNNQISNLRVISRVNHAIEDAKRNYDEEVTCTYCGKKFTVKGSKLHNRNRRDRHQSGYFCSKRCSGKYGAEIQNGRMMHQIVEKVIPKTYQVKSAQIGNSCVDVG